MRPKRAWRRTRNGSGANEDCVGPGTEAAVRTGGGRAGALGYHPGGASSASGQAGAAEGKAEEKDM